MFRGLGEVDRIPAWRAGVWILTSLTLLPPTLAYVTYQDIRAIGTFKEQTVIAVKAPPQTRLEVPDRNEVRGEVFGGEQGEEGAGKLCSLCPRHCSAPSYPSPCWYPRQDWWSLNWDRNDRSWKEQQILAWEKSLFLVSLCIPPAPVVLHTCTCAHTQQR